MNQGYVTDIKESDGRFGKSYQLYVDGKNLGFSKFPYKGVAVGDFVSYETEQKGQYLNLKAGSLSKINPPAGVAPPQRSAITMDRQDVISRQAALNTAIQFVELLRAAEALPAGAKNLAADKKADKIEAILMHYVKKFHLYSTGVAYEVTEEAAESGVQSWDEQS